MPTLFFIGGIAVQRLCAVFYYAFFLWIFIVILLWYYHQEKIFYITIYCITSFLFGCAAYYHQITQQQWWHTLIQHNNQLTVIARIDDIERKDHPYLKYAYLCTIQQLFMYDHYTPCHKKLMVLSPRKLHYEISDIVVIENIFIKPASSLSLQDYNIKENIVGIAIVTDQKHYLRYKPTVSFFRWLHKKRSSFLESIKQLCSPKTFSLVALLFFGNKAINKYHAQTLKTTCKQWGISHFLARSGLHLVIIISAWEFILKIIPIAFYIKQLIVLLLSIIYLFMSWTSLSFLRSFIVFIVYKIGTLLSQQAHTLHTITMVTLMLLLINPIQLYFLDFQLSFGITFILAWMAHLRHQKNSLSLNS